MKSLITLKVSHNRLRKLRATMFLGLSALTTLDLAHNSICCLPAEVFRGLQSLVSLHLQANFIRVIPSGLLGGLNTLRFLTLQGNKFTSLPAGLLSMENWLSVGLGYPKQDGALLLCNTDLCWLKQAEKAKKIWWEYDGGYLTPKCAQNISWELWSSFPTHVIWSLGSQVWWGLVSAKCCVWFCKKVVSCVNSLCLLCIQVSVWTLVSLRMQIELASLQGSLPQEREFSTLVTRATWEEEK